MKHHPSRTRDESSTEPPAGLPSAAEAPEEAKGHGLTVRSRRGVPEPRLPHERDESSDSLATTDPESAAVGLQAHEDVSRGLVDTSRALETDATYNGDPDPTPDPASPSPAEPPGGAARLSLGPGAGGATESGQGTPAGAAKEGPDGKKEPATAARSGSFRTG